MKSTLAVVLIVFSLSACKPSAKSAAKQFVDRLNEGRNLDGLLQPPGWKQGDYLCEERRSADRANASRMEARGPGDVLSAAMASQTRECLRVTCEDKLKTSAALLQFAREKGLTFALAETKADQPLEFGGKEITFFVPMAKRKATVTVELAGGGNGLFQFEELALDPSEVRGGGDTTQWFPAFGMGGYPADNLWCGFPALRRWAVDKGFSPP